MRCWRCKAESSRNTAGVFSDKGKQEKERGDTGWWRVSVLVLGADRVWAYVVVSSTQQQQAGRQARLATQAQAQASAPGNGSYGSTIARVCATRLRR